MKWLRKLSSREQLAAAAADALAGVNGGPIALTPGAPWNRALSGKLGDTVAWGPGEPKRAADLELAGAIIDGETANWTEIVAGVQVGGVVVVIGGQPEKVTEAALRAGLSDLEQKVVRRRAITRGVVLRFPGL